MSVSSTRQQGPPSFSMPEHRRTSARGGDASVAAPRPRWSSAPHSGGAAGVERSRTSDAGRRVLNVGFALIGLVMGAPLMAVVALAMKVTSPGPILAGQPRVGLDRRRSLGPDPSWGRRSADLGGWIFTAYTFRVTRESPVPDRDPPSHGEAEVTPLGSLLKVSRLERLPQLFNVLRGDMNIVGPRPERPDRLRELRAELGAGFRRYAERQRVLPGMIGPAQVERAWSGFDVPGNGLELDLEYVRSRSAIRDLSIMASIIPTLILRSVWEKQRSPSSEDVHDAHLDPHAGAARKPNVVRHPA